MLNLTDWIKDKETHGIIQHSDAWHKHRITTVGGSTLSIIQGVNPYKSLNELVRQKTGFSENINDGSIMTRWGNLFEDVIKRIVEHDKSCSILGEDLYVKGDDPYISYSPDGLAVINGEVTLLEFKCPYSRIPMRNIPKYYIPQIKMGLDVLKIPTVGLFVEGVFRRCSWEVLGHNSEHDLLLVDKQLTDLPKYYGIIGMYTTEEKLQASIMRLLIQKYETEYMIEEEMNDLGVSTADLFMDIMKAYDSGHIKIFYGGLTSGDNMSIIYDDLTKFTEYCDENKYIKLGILPWKLFQLQYNNVSKEENYLEPWMPKIRELVDVIKACNDPENIDKKYNIYSSYFEKINNV